jgi:O-antigen/teichoic acid export membrane protein
MRRTLLRHASQNLATQLAVAFTAVISSVVISRKLGAHSMGEYSFATFTSLTIVSFITLGLPTSLVRFVAEAEAKEDAPRVSRIIAGAIRFSAWTGIAATIAVALLIAAGWTAGIGAGVAIITALTLLPSIGGSVLSSVASAQQRFGALLRINTVVALVQLALTVLVAFVHATVMTFVAIFLVGFLIQCVLTWRLIRSSVHVRDRMEPALRKDFVRDTVSLSGVTVINTVVFQRSEVFFLAALSTKAEIAYYSLAYALVARGMLLLPGALTGVLLPKFAGGDDTTTTLDVSTRWLALITLPLMALIVVLADPIVQLLYGSSFAKVGPVLQIVAIASGMTVMITGASSAMLAARKQNVILKVGAVGALANIGLAILLTGPYGAVGAALAGGIAQTGCVAAGAVYMHRAMGLSLPLSALARTAVAAAIAGAAAMALAAAASQAIGRVALGATVFFPVYVAALLIVRALPSDEARVLTSRLRPRSASA